MLAGLGTLESSTERGGKRGLKRKCEKVFPVEVFINIEDLTPAAKTILAK